jgi:outer membrane protein insertion porin family
MNALLHAVIALALLAAEEPLGAPAETSAPSADALAAQPVAPIPDRPAPDLDPGPHLTRRYQIERIRISGLDHVKESEARRHLLVSAGELLDEERVLLSRLRLLQLGWFSRVETRVERGSARGLVVLVFDVSERNTVLVTDLVLGSTGPQPLYGGFGLSQQNFLGRGLGLSGAFVYGGSPSGRAEDPDRFALRASFFAPDVAVPSLRRGLVFGATALFVRGEELACVDPDCDAFDGGYGAAPVVRYQRVGGEATVGVRPGPFERLHATYRMERIRTDEAGAAAPRGEGPAILAGGSTLSAVTGTWELDTREDFFFPREGLRGVAQVTFGSRLLGSDYEYSRYLLNLETAFALLRLPLRLQATLGAAQGNAPFFERFYGADYSYFAIGPALARALELNFSTDSRYDAFLAMAGLEYGVPLWASGAFFRRGYLALGLRGVHSTATLGGGRTAFSRSPVSAEATLRLDTPVGVFNASLGYAADNFL